MFSYHFLLPFLLFLLSSSLLQISAAEDNGHALDLSSTFKSVVLPSLDKANWLVEFYSPMCGSCKVREDVGFRNMMRFRVECECEEERQKEEERAKFWIYNK